MAFKVKKSVAPYAGALVAVAALGVAGNLARASWGSGQNNSTGMPYAGFLEKDGVPLNGTMDLRLSVFAVPDAGNVLYQETISGVAVSAGQFSIIVGSGTTTSGNYASLLGAPELFLALEVQVTAPPPGDTGFVLLASRQRLGAAAYALRGAPGSNFVVDGRLGVGTSAPASALDVTGTVSEFGVPAAVPPGAVMFFYLPACPSGWVAADGAPVPGGAQFDRLRNAAGGSTPDLRGEFVRGLDTGRGVDNGRGLGSAQGDVFGAHTHRVSATRNLQYSGGGGRAWDSPSGAFDGNSPFIATSEATGSGETRPRNVALLACIKY